MKQVLIAVPFPPELLATIRDVSPDIEVEQVSFSDRKWPDGFSTAAEVYYAAGVMPSLELAPNLRWIQMHWAGINSLRDDGYTIPGTGDPQGELPDRVYPSEATRSMLKECDYVVITLPLTSQTHHLINRDMLKEMKPNAYLINIGRGSIIHEADLIHALKKGWIAGAGLDVFEEEPLPADSPLWQMENVILTPHISGFTPHYDERAVDLFGENLRRYLSGKPLLNLVNREREY